MHNKEITHIVKTDKLVFKTPIGCNDQNLMFFLLQFKRNLCQNFKIQTLSLPPFVLNI